MTGLASPAIAMRLLRVTKFASLFCLVAMMACSQKEKADQSFDGPPQGSNFGAKAKSAESKGLPDADVELSVDQLEELEGMLETASAVTLAPMESMILNDAESPSPNAGPNSDGGLGGGGGGRPDMEEARAKSELKSKKAVKTWKPAKAVANAARLSVGSNDDLDSQGMQISVAIDGWRARVVIDAYFLNPRLRQLEGTFKLRLPDGASPYYFAFGQTVFGQESKKADPDQLPVFFQVDEQGEMQMDVENIGMMRARTWEHVRESKMVTKEKAAHAYTETVRRRIDPALMEWNGAGVFSARVFPLAPKQLHRLVIGYDLDLTQAGDDLVMNVSVPEGLPSSRVDVGMHQGLGDLKLETSIKPTKTSKPANLSRKGREFLTWKNPDAGVIQLRLKDAGVISMNGQMQGKGHYHATRFNVAIDDKGVSGTKSNALFLLDTSASSNADKFHIWLKMMEAHLEENRDLLPTFNVLFFNIEQWWYKDQPVANTAANVKALIDYCNQLALEGATDIKGALDRAGKVRLRGLDNRVFLLSDGAATWGESDRDAMLESARTTASMGLFAFRTGLSGSDTATLNHLAVGTGGAVFAVVGEESIVMASRGFRRRPWKIVSVDHAFGESELLEGRPTHVYPGQDLKLVCRAIKHESEAEALITLKLDRDGEKTTLTFPINRSLSSHIAGRVYGQVATGQLESLVQLTEDKATAFARHFRVTGQTCSLLMLESEEDYASYNIKPENDAFVVKNSDVNEIVLAAEKELGARRGDPKLAFMHWANKMEKMPGVSFKLSPALKLMIEKMPSDAFRVLTEELVCTTRNKSSLGDTYLAKLGSKTLKYADVMKEAERRVGKAGNSHDQVKALSSLIEQNPGDQVLAREVAYFTQREGLGGQAYHLLRRVRDSRPWEAITYHALAKALRASGKSDLALVYYEIAMAGQWYSRFGDFKKIVAMDYQGFLEELSDKGSALVKDYAKERQGAISKEAGLSEADILVTMSWNTDSTDIDLHILEPSGEDCHYGNRNTRIGGRLTQDVTQGYGPEMYVLKDAKAGSYLVRAEYFGNNSSRSGVATKIEVTVHRNFGREGHSYTTKILELEKGKSRVDVQTLTVN